MGRFCSSVLGLAALSVALFFGTPVAAHSQEDLLGSAFGNATDFSFLWTQAGAPKGDFKPEREAGATGIGFEVAFKIPGGFRRSLTVPDEMSSTPEGGSCSARFARGELRQGAKCADTTVTSVKRTRTNGVIAYEEELKIDEFEWEVPLLSLEFALGFSQTGAYIARRADRDIRVSLRETPSVSLYATYEPRFRIAGKSFRIYGGARSGLLSLIGGRAFSDSVTTKLSGETFQIGPVAGVVSKFRGINVFVEGAYMWRNFRSVDWDGETGLGNLPRAINFTGGSVAIGVQFEFKSQEGN